VEDEEDLVAATTNPPIEGKVEKGGGEHENGMIDDGEGSTHLRPPSQLVPRNTRATMPIWKYRRWRACSSAFSPVEFM
jgi:hypothetical protein